ncbi:MAG: CPBP family intramembrane metalloprotease [Anaerolineae bacterium]|nr:CPBP family intramembrane metalloprotease [Anaerolineae bacterium]
MIKSILKKIRLPEPYLPPWGMRLAFGTVVMFAVALFLGLLITTTIREDNPSDAQAPSIIMGAAIGSVMALTLAYQYSSGIVLKKQESSKHYKQTVAQSLGLIPSRSRPLWITSLAAWAVAIALDTVTLILGKSDTSLPLGLDRMDGADTLTWIMAAVVFIVLRPAAEEVIFRGILYPIMVKRTQDNVQAVGWSAVLFALFYFIQAFTWDVSWEVTYWSLAYPLIIGLTAGLIRAHTKSTTAAIFANSMFGAFLIMKALLTLA